MLKRRLPWLAGVMALMLGLGPLALAATPFSVSVSYALQSGATNPTASAIDTVSGAVYAGTCTGTSCTISNLTGSYAIVGSQTNSVSGAVYDSVYLGGAVSSAATNIPLNPVSVIPAGVEDVAYSSTSPAVGTNVTVTATVYGGTYASQTQPDNGTLLTITGGSGSSALSFNAVSGYGAGVGTTVSSNVYSSVYAGTVSGAVKFQVTSQSAGTYSIDVAYPGTGQIATIPITFGTGAVIIGSSSSSSTTSTSSGTSVGPTGGTLACTDGSFTDSIPAGAVPSGQTEACADQATAPSGLPPLPANMVALSNYVTLTGPTLSQTTTATLKFNPSALNGMSTNRIEVFADPGGQWLFLPTTVNASSDTAQVRVTGNETLVVLGNTQTFPDVSSTYWARSYIDTMLGAGAINGFPDGTFQPGGLLTRAQFVKMLVIVDQIAPDASGTTPFTDVAPGDWFAPYVAAAYSAGLVQGVSPTSFDPNAGVTREQMAVLLARALKLAGTTSLTFSDASQIDTWALSGVQAAVAAGYLSGFPNGTFEPLATTTRDQSTKVLSLIITNEAPGAAMASGVSSIAVSPNPVAAAGSLAADQAVNLTVTAKNASGAAVPNATVYLSFTAATGGGTAEVGTTPLSTTTQAFTTNAAGEATVTYTAPTAPPATGTDTLTVSTGPGGTGVSSTDSYTFNTGS